MPAGNPIERESTLVEPRMAGLPLAAARGCWLPPALAVSLLSRLRQLTGDIEQAQKHFQMVLELAAPEDLHGLARNGLRKIAVRGLKANGAEDGCGLPPAGCAVTISRKVAGGDPGDLLRDRDAGGGTGWTSTILGRAT